MKLLSKPRCGFTLVEMMITTVLIGILGLIIYSLLSTGTILGAKNTAVNTAHQEARSALLRMTNDLHSAISPLALVDWNPLFPNDPTKISTTLTNTGSAGVSFLVQPGDPVQIAADVAIGDDTIKISVPTGGTLPKKYQRLVVPSYQVESDIIGVSGTVPGTITLTLADSLTVAINATTYNVAAFVANHCLYIVHNGALEFRTMYNVHDGILDTWSSSPPPAPAVLAKNITEPKPFTTDGQLAILINLPSYGVRQFASANFGFRQFTSANVVLDGRIPTRAKLVTKAQ